MLVQDNKLKFYRINFSNYQFIHLYILHTYVCIYILMYAHIVGMKMEIKKIKCVMERFHNSLP